MKSRFGSPRRRAAALAAAVVGILAVNAAPALAVSCGDVITTSIRLEQDLNCPASTGLIIGAPGVTVDLHNHTITGGPGFAGIQSDNFHNNMTVTDGTIEGFGAAVDLTGNGTEVSRVRAINNVVTGITLVGANQLITRNVVTGGSNTGIFAVNLVDSVISRNRVRGVQNDILLDGTSGNQVTRNLATDAVGTGFSINMPGANNVVTDNRALRNGLDGLVIVGGGVASRNRAEFNDVGIFVQGFADGGRNRAKHNRINCQGVACQN